MSIAYRRLCVLLIATAICGCTTTPAAGPDGAVASANETSPRWQKEAEPSDRAKAIGNYLSALIHASRGENDKSLEFMSKVPELDPEATTPTIQLIRAYLQKEDYEAALEMSERAVKLRPDEANLHVVLGEIYHRFKRYDEAMVAFQTAIELDPENVLGYGALVELQESRNDLTSAIDIYERLAEISPETAGVYYQLALVLIRIDDKEGAIEALKKTLELNPSLVRAQYLLGVLYLETNQNEDCIAQLSAYMRGRPNDMDAADNLAGAQARAGRFEQSIALYQRILSSNQSQPQHHIAAMYLHLRAKRYDEVAALAPAREAPYFDMVMRALAQQEEGLNPQLLVKALETIEGDLDAECGRYLNTLLYLFGRESTGQWLYDALTRLSEQADSRVLHLLRARTLMAMERHQDAISILDTVLAKFTPDPWVHYYLAICHEELDQFAETEQNLRAYMSFIPDDPDILNFLAYLYAEEGIKLNEAIALLDTAMKADPENPYYLDSLGWVYFKQGRADQAVQCIQQAIYGMDTDDAVLRDHLGDAYFLQGDAEKAVEEWKRALRLNSALPGLKEKIDAHVATPVAP